MSIKLHPEDASPLPEDDIVTPDQPETPDKDSRDATPVIKSRKIEISPIDKPVLGKTTISDEIIRTLPIDVVNS